MMHKLLNHTELKVTGHSKTMYRHWVSWNLIYH